MAVPFLSVSWASSGLPWDVLPNFFVLWSWGTEGVVGLRKRSDIFEGGITGEGQDAMHGSEINLQVSSHYHDRPFKIVICWARPIIGETVDLFASSR